MPRRFTGVYGRIRATKEYPTHRTWQVGVLVHGYNFTRILWETILGSVEGLDLPDLSEGNEARTSLEFNLTQLLDSRDYDYVFVEWVVGKGGNGFTSGIVGDCLTTSGAASIEEIVEDARFKLGISGSLNDRIVNSVKISMEIHGRGPTTFLLLLASGLMPLVVAIPYIVLKKAIKGVITKSEVSDTHHQPAELDRLKGRPTRPGAVMRRKQSGGKKCCRDDFFLLSGCLPYIRPGFDLPIGPD